MQLLTRHKFYLFLAVLVAVGGCGESSVDFSAKRYVLENEAQLIVLPDRRFPVITQMIWYPVGSGDERAGKTGLAHTLEHLMFQHEPHLAQGGFSSIIESLGGRDNAFTSYDYTAYYQRFHPDRLEEIMKLEAQRMTALAISKKSVVKELDVVEEEYYTRQKGEPLVALRNQMSAALYGADHPYGRPVIGVLSDIQSIALEDANAFYKNFYDPARAIIVIAGDIEGDKAYALAQEFYGSLKTSERRTAAAAVAADFPPVLQRQSKKKTLIRRDKRAHQAVLLRYYTTTNRHILGPKQAAGFEVLAQVLTGSPQAQINYGFIVEEKLASFVGGWLDIDKRGPGQFSIQIWLSPKANKKVIKRAYRKLDVMLKNLASGKTAPTEEEIMRAKNRLLASSIYLKDNPFNLARFVGGWLATGHSLEAAQHWSSYIEAVSSDDVRQAAQYMLKPDRAVSGLLLPKR